MGATTLAGADLSRASMNLVEMVQADLGGADLSDFGAMTLPAPPSTIEHQRVRRGASRAAERTQAPLVAICRDAGRRQT